MSDTRPFCDFFKCSFGCVGTAFADFCQELKKEIAEIKCPESSSENWAYSSGPVYKDLNLKSIISNVVNRNSFPVRARYVINLLNGPILPYYYESKIIEGCGNTFFEIVDMVACNNAYYNITYFFTSEDDSTPIKTNMRMYASGRSDLPSTSIENSHIIASQSFPFYRFAILKYDPEAKPIMPPGEELPDFSNG